MNQKHILLFYTLVLAVCYFTLHSAKAWAAPTDTATRLNLTPDMVFTDGQTTPPTALGASATANISGTPTLDGTPGCCGRNTPNNDANNGTPVRLGPIELAGAGTLGPTGKANSRR